MANSISHPAGPRLPIEVIEHILDSIQELLYEQHDVFFHDLYPVWKACALTCRSMVPRSQYWLFRTINLGKQSQAESLMEILRRNPKVAEYTHILVIAGPLGEEESAPSFTWISWIPSLFAPRMTNLNELQLEGDIFSKCHQSFPMALTAFRSIRKLSMFNITFSTFRHCSHLIRGFPHLDHLGSLYLSWKPRSSYYPYLHRYPNTRSCKLHITHLDLWSDTPDGIDLHEFVQFMGAQDHSILRTLCLQVGNNDFTPSILRRASHVHSVFLMLPNDRPVLGCGDLTHLQVLHVHLQDDKIPIQFIISIILSVSSRSIRKLAVYIDLRGNNLGDKWNDRSANDLDAYRRLDDALCTPVFKDLELTLCLCRSDSVDAIKWWKQKLSTLLPKFHLQRESRVECALTKDPNLKWIKLRDGF